MALSLSPKVISPDDTKDVPVIVVPVIAAALFAPMVVPSISPEAMSTLLMSTSPVPLGVRAMLPLVSVLMIVLPLMLMLSTSRSPVIFVVAVILTAPVPLGVMLIAPLVSVLIIVLPSMLILSTSRSPVILAEPVTLNSVEVNVVEAVSTVTAVEASMSTVGATSSSSTSASISS